MWKGANFTERMTYDTNARASSIASVGPNKLPSPAQAATLLWESDAIAATRIVSTPNRQL